MPLHGPLPSESLWRVTPQAVLQNPVASVTGVGGWGTVKSTETSVGLGWRLFPVLYYYSSGGFHSVIKVGLRLLMQGKPEQSLNPEPVHLCLLARATQCVTYDFSVIQTKSHNNKFTWFQNYRELSLTTEAPGRNLQAPSKQSRSCSTAPSSISTLAPCLHGDLICKYSCTICWLYDNLL